ncbi:hypothetical protein TNIN_98111 [Trichonephila inaurata madagascariensis]|uniref:Uncharacterized protein n=1 Tax=Trichonephila inaurata madagascariensis TaxID=2747483 RepID=A0A8X6XR78_9ARAC|nr:hypothetical protein TNIN_98111 [Trichonephila inaurata madagascariensis]
MMEGVKSKYYTKSRIKIKQLCNDPANVCITTFPTTAQKTNQLSRIKKNRASNSDLCLGLNNQHAASPSLTNCADVEKNVLKGPTATDMKSRVIPSSETKKPGSFDTGGGVERGRSCVRKCSNDEHYPGWVRGGRGEVIRPDGGMLFR